MKISKKVLVVFAVVFFVGYAGGIVTEHVIHGLQDDHAHNGHHHE